MFAGCDPSPARRRGQDRHARRVEACAVARGRAVAGGGGPYACSSRRCATWSARGRTARRPDGRQASDQQDAAAPRPGLPRSRSPWNRSATPRGLRRSVRRPACAAGARRVPGLPRGAARAPRPTRSPIAEQAQDEQWAALVGRLRCMRGIDTLTAVGLIPRSATSTPSSTPSSWPASSAWSRPRVLRRAASPGLDHQGRHQPRPPVADRSRLALPPPNRDFADPPPPPGRPAAGRDRAAWRASCGSSAAGRTSTRAAPSAARPSRSPSHANWPVLSGRSPTNPTDPDRIPVRDGGGGRRTSHGTRDCAMSTRPRLARSILERGPGAANSRL